MLSPLRKRTKPKMFLLALFFILYNSSVFRVDAKLNILGRCLW